MQIVIDIPEEIIKLCKDDKVSTVKLSAEYFRNGTVLPKHGRLKDIDWIDDNCRNYYTDDDGSWCYKWKDIEDAPTILDATGEAE